MRLSPPLMKVRFFDLIKISGNYSTFNLGILLKRMKIIL